MIIQSQTMLTVPASWSSEILEEERSKEHPSSLLDANEMWHSHLRLQKHKVNRYSVLEFEQVSTSWGNDHILSFKVTSHLFVNDGPFMLISNVICEQTCPNPITMLHRNPANLICLICCMVWLLCGSIPLTSLHLLSTSEPASLLRQLRFVWPPCIHSHSRKNERNEVLWVTRKVCPMPTKELASAFLLW